jgi:hypothetical protein
MNVAYSLYLLNPVQRLRSAVMHNILGDGYACVDMNECTEWGTCSQLCTNTVGSHKCNCAEGYVMINNSCMVTGRAKVFLNKISGLEPVFRIATVNDF